VSPLHATVAAVARGSFRVKAAPAIQRERLCVMESFEAALLAFHQAIRMAHFVQVVHQGTGTAGRMSFCVT